ncbi:MAG: galactose ABC transporter substrate-binding protein [Clostridia bacterium]|nr:galactose ABC transporter substrate-binding protein [Clostridia bacterium]
MKRIIPLLCAALLVFNACQTNVNIGKQAKDKSPNLRIGVSIYDEYDTFISEIVTDIKKWAIEKETEYDIPITLEVVSASKSQLTQNDQIEKFAEKGYDVVCVNLVDRTDASVIIEKAKNYNMPIVFFNRELVEEDLERWDKLYYVGAAAKQSGELQGDLIVNACKEKFDEIDLNGDRTLQYVMLEGEPGHQDALVRTQSSISKVLDAGYTVEKLGDEIANWNREQASTKMNLLLDKYPSEIEVIFANNDNMALGAIDALNEHRIKKFPLIVGVDGDIEALEMIKTKKMLGTIYNDADNQARVIIELAYSLALQQEIPKDLSLINDKYVYLPYQTINYNNVQQYIVNKNK